MTFIRWLDLTFSLGIFIAFFSFRNTTWYYSELMERHEILLYVLLSCQSSYTICLLIYNYVFNCEPNKKHQQVMLQMPQKR